MDYSSAAVAVKPYLRPYVEGITKKSMGGNYVCPLCGSGTGKHKSGAFSIYGEGTKWQCFACGKGGDLIDLIGEHEQIPDSRTRIERAAEIYGIKIDTHTDKRTYTHTDKPKAKPQAETGQGDTKAAAKDFLPFFRECAVNRTNSSYLQSRCIADELQERFMIGFCKDWVSPTAKENGKNPPPTARVIIPTSRGSYIARATDPGTDPAYSKMKEGAVTPFNHKALATAKQPIFIVEGEIDALSIMTAGGEAIGIGSTVMVDRFLRDYVDRTRPTHPLIVALDNDGKEQTRKATEKLLGGLRERGIVCIEYNTAGDFKDANEALCKSPGAFELLVKDGIRQAEEAATAAATAERTAYSDEYSALALLPGFMKAVKSGGNSDIHSTGFTSVDDALDGGLDQGLCFIGAISSLGKTTLTLQIADFMAAQGKDVLFFTLEMPTAELISKSLSRHTLQYSLRTQGDIRAACTNRAILRKYDTLPQIEKSALTIAAEEYQGYADHVFIFEGVGDIGAEQIRETVARHKQITGNTPIVFVDYAQILAPYNERYTDKQNTDKAVLELKRISRDFDTVVFAISSFNRENYTAPVNMASFKESGAIEYSADVLIGLQYEGMDFMEEETEKAHSKRVRELLAEQIQKGKKGEAQAVEVKILKNRNGSRGTARLMYYPMFNTFIDTETDESPF